MKRALLGIISILFAVAAGAVLTLGGKYLSDYRADHRELEKDVRLSDEQVFDEEYNSFYGIDRFETALPVIYITTEEYIQKDIPTVGRISILNAGADGKLHAVSEKPDVTFDAAFKIRGASSSHFEKSQYRVKLLEDAESGKEAKYDLLGMGRESEWVLNGPFLDRTLTRNYVAYHLAGEILEWAPECRYVELFLNGQYRGVYLAVEPITNGEGRLRLSTFGFLSGETAYIISRDRIGSDTDALKNYGSVAGLTPLSLYVEYPGKKNITDREYAWIENDISSFERALFGPDYADPDLGYAKYIDIDNFVDYYIINEMFMNHDGDTLSTYAYKELGGKLKLCVWDFNNSVDNYQWFKEDYEEFFLLDGSWFSRLLKDRNFVDKIVARYRELRTGTLSTEHMLALIDAAGAELGDAVTRNFQVWGYTFDINLLVSSGRDLRDYEAAVTQFKEGLKRRGEFLDAHITDLYAGCE